MERFQSFKFELRPNAAQLQQLERLAGCCRFVFNQALALQKKRTEDGEPLLSGAELERCVLQWRLRAESSWLADVPVSLLLQALKNLQRGESNYLAGRAGFPTFKKKGTSDSFRFPRLQDFELNQKDRRIVLPHLGYMRYRGSRAILGTPKNATLIASGGKWFVSILTLRQVPVPIARGTVVGIDMGIARFATLSDGSFYAPLNSFRRHEKALAAANRAFSKKIRFSNNWRKQKAKLQRIHARIRSARQDYLHKISSSVSQNHAAVCIEDLRVTAMSASRDAEGSRMACGPAKRGLNKSILDQGWYEFRRQLEYKLKWAGARLVVVPPHNTSRTCPTCGYAAAENRLSQEVFSCVRCGFQENADLVGAINILRAGHARLACAESSPAYEALGQEPAGQDLIDPQEGIGGRGTTGVDVKFHVKPLQGTHTPESDSESSFETD
jgi:putative transposase